MSSPSRSASLSLFTDSRRALSGSVSGFFFRTQFGTYSNGGNGSLTWRPLPNAQLSVLPSYTATREMAYLVAAAPDSIALATYGTRYVFGALRQTTLSIAVRAATRERLVAEGELLAESLTRERERSRDRAHGATFAESGGLAVARAARSRLTAV